MTFGLIEAGEDNGAGGLREYSLLMDGMLFEGEIGVEVVLVLGGDF